MNRLRQSLGLDLRSLALFRILLASLLLLDLALRSADLTAFYTDQGVLAREFWAGIVRPWQWSLHVVSGEMWWQILLFTLAALFAIGLLVGYRTRLMSAASFLLLASLLNRNPLILGGDDILLVALCFWSLFLPLGNRWSFDAALQDHYRETPNKHPLETRDNRQLFSIGTIALTLQILLLYTCTAFLKTGDAWTERFDAAWYAVSLDHFATPIGVWLRDFEGLLSIGTVYVLTIEFVGPLLVIAPFYWPVLRMVGLAALASLHIMFLASLHIGLFPLIDLAALSALIPGWLWNRIDQWRGDRKAGQIVLHYDKDCGFCLKMVLVLREFLLPRKAIISPAQKSPEIYAIMEAENSWVVTDSNDRPFIHWHAMALLFRQRWWSWPAGWLMSRGPLLYMGNRLYSYIATHRDQMGEITRRWLPWRRDSTRTGLISSAAAGAMLVVVVVYNLAPLPQIGIQPPPVVSYIAGLSRLNQRWDMFSPYPITASIYPVVTGRLRNGESVDLYPGTSSSPEWFAQRNLYPLYKNYRWRKYIGRLHSNRILVDKQAYGTFFCKNWNGPMRERARQLATLNVVIVRRHVSRNETNPETRKTIWRHWCFSEFSPKSG